MASDVNKLLHDELRTCIRLLECYERSERGRGNTQQADAIGRHLDRVCAASIYAKGVTETSPGVFSTGGLYAYHYQNLSEGTLRHLRELLASEKEAVS